MTSNHDETFRSLIDLLEKVPVEFRCEFSLLLLLRNFEETTYMAQKLQNLGFGFFYISYCCLPKYKDKIGLDYNLIFEYPYWYNGHLHDKRDILSSLDDFKKDFHSFALSLD